MTEIVEILAWPVTIIIVVALMRSPLSELVPTLKRLKYKDLEVEFEREANKILSEVERDFPEKPKDEIKDTGILYSRRRPQPAKEILDSWSDLEYQMIETANNLNIDIGESTRSLISGLETSGYISKDISKVALDLAALKNKVAHANTEVITYDVSSAFCKSVERVKFALLKMPNKAN